MDDFRYNEYAKNMNAKNDLIFFVLILVGLFVVWIGTGGPERAGQREQGGVVLEQSKTVIREDTSIREDTRDSQPQGGEEETLADEEEEPTVPAGISPYKDQVTIAKRSSGPRKDEADKEYIEIRANRSNTTPVPITGWRVASIISGRSYAIGDGTRLPYSGVISPEGPIFLNPNDKAYIATGRSPIGISFRTNICTGYFEQFQDFSPTLRRECPRPKDELIITANIIQTFENECIDFIGRLPRCEMPINALPPRFRPECIEFITTRINYTGCVDNHRNDADFFKSEWRIFLGRDKEIWREKRETIRLLDARGLVVDTFTY